MSASPEKDGSSSKEGRPLQLIRGWLHDGFVPAGGVLEGVGPAVPLHHDRDGPSA